MSVYEPTPELMVAVNAERQKFRDSIRQQFIEQGADPMEATYMAWFYEAAYMRGMENILLYGNPDGEPPLRHVGEPPVSEVQ